MANVFTAIGFDIETEEAFGRVAIEVAYRGQTIPAPGGCYHRFRAGAGAELWLQSDPDGRIVGMEPHFDDEGDPVAGLLLQEAYAEGALDGAFRAWNGVPEESGYPLVFHVPDFAYHARRRLPATADVQLAALAYELSAYADDGAYCAGQEEGVRFAAEMFIPSGMFGEAAPGEAFVPAPRALLAGHVVATEERVNPWTGRAVRWARVRTLGAELDVAADPSIIQGEVVAGGVVSGSFWLSGRIVRVHDEPVPTAAAMSVPGTAKSRRPWWRRLFGA